LRESFRVNEIHVVWLDGALVAWVDDFTEEEKINVSLTDVRRLCVSEIELVVG